MTVNWSIVNIKIAFLLSVAIQLSFIKYRLVFEIDRISIFAYYSE